MVLAQVHLLCCPIVFVRATSHGTCNDGFAGCHNNKVKVAYPIHRRWPTAGELHLDDEMVTRPKKKERSLYTSSKITHHKRPRESNRDDNGPSKRNKYDFNTVLSNLASHKPYPVLSSTHSETRSTNHPQRKSLANSGLGNKEVANNPTLVPVACCRQLFQNLGSVATAYPRQLSVRTRD